MKYTIENSEQKCKVIFELDKQEWEKALNDAYQKTKDKYVVQGFRSGHAPRKYIETQFGPTTFFDEAFNVAFPVYFNKMLAEHTDICPVETPSLDILDFPNDGVKFSAEFAVKPDVDLGQYTGLKIEAQSGIVSDEDIERELNLALDRASRMVEVDSPIQNGDFVNLDYKGMLDGIAFDGGTAQNQELEIGSKTFIQGFEEQLIGLKVGDTKSINCTFPKDYHSKNLAGKAVVFDCKIIKVKQKQYPELNDDFARDVSTFDTLEEYKRDLTQKLQKTTDENANNSNLNKLLDTIAQNAKVNIPDAMINSQIDSYMQEFEYRLSANGLKLDDYLRYTGLSAKDMRSMRIEDAKKTVRLRLVLQKIVEKEKIEPSNQEIDEKLFKRADNLKKSLEEYKKGINERELDYITNEIIMDKLIEWLKKNNEFVYNNNVEQPKSESVDNNLTIPSVKKVKKETTAKQKSKINTKGTSGVAKPTSTNTKKKE